MFQMSYCCTLAGMTISFNVLNLSVATYFFLSMSVAMTSQTCGTFGRTDSKVLLPWALSDEYTVSGLTALDQKSFFNDWNRV